MHVYYTIYKIHIYNVYYVLLYINKSITPFHGRRGKVDGGRIARLIVCSHSDRRNITLHSRSDGECFATHISPIYNNSIELCTFCNPYEIGNMGDYSPRMLYVHTEHVSLLSFTVCWRTHGIINTYLSLLRIHNGRLAASISIPKWSTINE